MKLKEQDLEALIGEPFLERGERYFREGMVEMLEVGGTKVEAAVHGSRDYRTSLEWHNKRLSGHCTCPAYNDIGPCKHMAAVGYAVIASNAPEAASPKRKGRRTVMELLADYLEGQPPGALCNIILHEAKRNKIFRKRLELLSKTDTKEVDISALRRALRQAIGNGKYVDYYEAAGWVDGIQAVVDTIARLPMRAHASSIRELAEYGMELLNEALGYVDDSNGESLNTIEMLQSLHLEACRVSKPDPKELAEFLLHKELDDGFGFYYGASERYGAILGKTGLAHYRKLADALWEEQPLAKPKERRGFMMEFDPVRSSLRRIVERLHADDPQALIRILQKDLDDAHDYLELARRYDAASQPDEALKTAEEGWKIFCKQFPDWRLLEYLVESYHRNDRQKDALALLWKEYDMGPSFDRYKQLKTYAERCTCWPEWKDKVITRAKKTVDRSDASLLVQIYLFEVMQQEAWDTAQQHGCYEKLWLELAKIRATAHPQDAIGTYQRIAEEKIRQTEKKAYKEAFDLIQKVQSLQCVSAEGQAAFTAWLTHLKTTYKAKRNMMKLLDSLPTGVAA